MKQRLLNELGIVKTMPKQGKKTKPKKITERTLKKQAEIDKCLNCTKKECGGCCYEMRKMR